MTVLTGLPLAALAWPAWQVLQQDRNLELQRHAALKLLVAGRQINSRLQ